MTRIRVILKVLCVSVNYLVSDFQDNIRVEIHYKLSHGSLPVLCNPIAE